MNSRDKDMQFPLTLSSLYHLSQSNSLRSSISHKGIVIVHPKWRQSQCPLTRENYGSNAQTN